jgi:AraC-like DNA-binding protein
VSNIHLLADSVEYRPFIRAAGTGKHRRNPNPTGHRAQLSYLLQWTPDAEIDVIWPDETVTTVNGTGWIVPPGTAYSTSCRTAGTLTYVHFTVDQNPLWRSVHPHFCFGLCDEHVKMLQPSPEIVWGLRIPRSLPPLCCDRFSVQLPAIVNDWLSHERARTWRAQDRFSTLLHNIISDIMFQQEQRPELSPEARIARAETVASQSLHLAFDVNHMARIAGYERSYFSQLYKRMRGESAKCFLADLRVEEAKRLLRTTNLTVADIAVQLGYRESIVLTRMFKRHTRETPVQWRQRNADSPRTDM